MNVSAVIVTRGNVDLLPVLDSLPQEWERLVWQNGKSLLTYSPGEAAFWPMEHPPAHGGYWPDLSVYGRYAAIEYASHDLIYVQDDDVIVSDPQAIVDAWVYARDHHDDGFPRVPAALRTEHLVANMPPEFRHDGYTDSCLVGFGACFHRDLPHRVFAKFRSGAFRPSPGWLEDPWFQRTCDVVFTTLTPRVLVDVPKTDREFASDPDRMWKQPDHVGERVRMLELARMVRDA